MDPSNVEYLRFALQLVRNQHRQVSQSAFRFSLYSLFGVVTASCTLTWFLQEVIRAHLRLPPAMHLLFLDLWVSVIIGVALTNGQWWYLVGGTLGVWFCSVGLMAIYVRDLAPVPLLTMWSVLIVFAMFANLGGGIWWIRNNRDVLAAVAMTLFVASIVAMVFLVAG